MTSIEVIRIVGEVIGLVAFLSAGMWWLTKLLWRIYGEVTSVHESLNEINGTVVMHTKQINDAEHAIDFLRGREAARAEVEQSASRAAQVIKDAANDAVTKLTKEADDAAARLRETR